MPTVLITGANRGLGLEFVRQYAREGWQVIAACRGPEKASALQALAREHAGVRIEALDVADAASLAACVGRLGDVAVDVLINNAGILSGNPKVSGVGRDDGQAFGALDSAAWARVLYVNSIAPIMVTEALFPCVRRGTGRKIVMISSRMGSIGETSATGRMAYRTSKAALNAAMRNVALSLRDEGISVVSFHPGWVKTDMGGPDALLTADVSIAGMRKVIDGLTVAQSGQFLNYDGGAVAW